MKIIRKYWYLFLYALLLIQALMWMFQFDYMQTSDTVTEVYHQARAPKRQELNSSKHDIDSRPAYNVKKEEASSVCGYWNANGNFAIRKGCDNIDGYGASAKIIIPEGITYLQSARLSFWQRAVVEGEGTLDVDDSLSIGIHGNLRAAKAEFNVPVIVNGTIFLSNGSSVKFNKGIAGDYKCVIIHTWKNKETVPCPF